MADRGSGEMMKGIAVGAALLSLGWGIAQAFPQLTSDQSRVLDAVRTSALAYTKKLPDFICTQNIHRDVSRPDAFSALGVSGRTPVSESPVDPAATGFAKVIQERVTFYGEKEDYRVVSVDGRKVTGVDPMQLAGATSAGEFGTALHDIFDLKSHTVFRWDKKAKLHGREVLVFAFHVPRDGGATVIHRNPDLQVVVPYSGRIFVDVGSLDALRSESTLELPAGFPIESAEKSVDYSPIEIAGREYVLPVHSEVRLRDRIYLYVNRIDFRDYHKFAVDSKIEGPSR